MSCRSDPGRWDMHSLTVVENVSLDGVMQAPASAEEDPRDGFDAGGWAGERLAGDPEVTAAVMGDGPPAAGMLFGHRTYDQLVGHWLSVGVDNPFTEILRRTPKYVTSREAATVLPHPNSHLLAGSAEQTVADLKRRGEGELVVLGSGELVRSLAAAGLVDRYLLTTIPVVLGRGRKLFDSTPMELEVESNWSSPTGITVTRYRVRG